MKMKVALFSLLSLMCLQVALVASAHISEPEPDSRTRDSKQENKTELASTCHTNNLLQPEQRLNVITCFWAFKDFGKVTWKGWSIFSEKKKNSNKATEGKLNCYNTIGSSEDLEKCLKTVEEEYKKEDAKLNQQLFELMPKILTTFLAVLSCLF